MADDLGYGDIGCYGNKDINTPWLDCLASRGMRFTDFHSNGAVCSPTRAALMTGRYQQRTGINGVMTAARHRHTGMDLGEVTFAEVLKKAGYATGLFGKWHLGYDAAFNPVRQGFDEFTGYVSGNVDYFLHIDQEGFEDWWKREKLTPEKGYSTDLITEHGLHFIERHQDKPFCLYLAHEAPHYPYQGSNDKAIRSVESVGALKGLGNDRESVYKEMIEAMDSGIGIIVRKLQQLHLDENTLVFFCSDNGPGSIGSPGRLRGRKGDLFEGGHRVPAIAYWPGIVKADTICRQTVMTMDLFPTMVSLAGERSGESLNLDGVDISLVLTAGGQLSQRNLFWKHGKSMAVRDDKWKLIAQKDSLMLFDLETDLAEKHDVAEKCPAVTKRLYEKLLQWKKEVEAGVDARS